ncbi:unnamed protein product [Boreogadus saida]
MMRLLIAADNVISVAIARANRLINPNAPRHPLGALVEVGGCQDPVAVISACLLPLYDSFFPPSRLSAPSLSHNAIWVISTTTTIIVFVIPSPPPITLCPPLGSAPLAHLVLLS